MARTKKHRNAIKKHGGKKVDAQEILKKGGFRKHNVRLFRERIVGISKQELARRLDVTGQTIYDWESPNKPNATPSYENLLKLCEVFGCQPVDLYSDFDVEYLGTMLDDMLELILADFNQNIRSRRLSEKQLAMKQFEVLCQARDYNERKERKDNRDKNSENKRVEMHKMRYEESENLPNEEDTNEEDTNVVETPEE